MDEIRASNTDNSLEEFFMSVTDASVQGGEKFDEKFGKDEFSE